MPVPYLILIRPLLAFGAGQSSPVLRPCCGYGIYARFVALRSRDYSGSSFFPALAQQRDKWKNFRHTGPHQWKDFTLIKRLLVKSAYYVIKALIMETKSKFHPNPHLKLMDQVREVLRYRCFAYCTEQAYCQRNHCYIQHFAAVNNVTASVPGQVRHAFVHLDKREYHEAHPHL